MTSPLPASSLDAKAHGSLNSGRASTISTGAESRHDDTFSTPSKECPKTAGFPNLREPEQPSNNPLRLTAHSAPPTLRYQTMAAMSRLSEHTLRTAASTSAAVMI